MQKTITLLAFTSMLYCSSPKLYAWENKLTHPALTEKAIEISDLDDFVKGQLELESGVHAELVCMLGNFHDFEKRIKAAGQDASRQRTILEWVKAGSIIEDEGILQYRPLKFRFNNHFFDPTRNSGLDNTEHSYRLSSGFKGLSALEWAINGGSETNWHSWNWARHAFHQALSYPDKNFREYYLAEAFLHLGHTAHMIQDMGVPAHVRNDSLNAHVRSLKDKGEAMESWVEKQTQDGQFSWSGQSPTALGVVVKRASDSRKDDDCSLKIEYVTGVSG